MSIRQDFYAQPKLPPRPFMEQIMNEVGKCYCFLWDHKNEQNRFKMKWKDLSRYYHRNSFRSSVRKLNNQGLLSFKETEDGIAIEMVGWDEIETAL